MLPYECENIREHLPEYAEGALTGRDLARVEQHLASCGRCREEVADLRAVMSAVRAVTPDPVPDTLLPRLRLAAQERMPAPVSRLLWPRLAVPLALVAALIAVSFALRQPKPSLEFAAGLTRTAKSAPAAPGVAQSSPGEEFANQAIPGAEEATSSLAAGAPHGKPAGAEPQQLREQAPSLAGQPPRLATAEPEALSRSAAGEVTTGVEASGELAAEDASVTREAKTPAPPGAGALGARAGRGTRGADRRPLGGPPRRPNVPGPPERQGPYAMRGRWERQKTRGERDEEAAGPAGPAARAETAAAAPPLFAVASLVEGTEGKVIALEVTSTGPTDSITLRLGGGPPQTFHWRGTGERAAVVPLPMDRIGKGPAAVPVEVTSSAGKRDYVLFVPPVSRLGQIAPNAPVAEYQAAQLESVLADLSKMTGLVILAEQPLDRKISGAIPKGAPEESLRQFGAANGFEVHTQGDAVATMTHRR